MPVTVQRNAGRSRGVAPELGEHSEPILTEMLGYSWDEIAELRQAGVL